MTRHNRDHFDYERKQLARCEQAIAEFLEGIEGVKLRLTEFEVDERNRVMAVYSNHSEKPIQGVIFNDDAWKPRWHLKLETEHAKRYDAQELADFIEKLQQWSKLLEILNARLPNPHQ